MSLVAYVADAAILGTYWNLARRGSRGEVWFHLANAVGCAPLLWVEVRLGAWEPLILTAAFGVIGWMGLWRHRSVLRDDTVEDDRRSGGVAS